MPLVVGIDLGTTGTKVTLVDPDRGVVASARRGVDLESPAPGFAEADTAQWWSNVVTLVPEVMEQAAVAPGDVAAISTSGMVPAVITIDASGRPLRRAILQNDARAVDELAELGSELQGLDLVTLTGSPLSQQSVAPTLRWLARHEPALWSRTVSVVGSYDWLLRALGARPHVETNWAIESGLYDLTASPVEAVVDAAGASGLLPPVARSGELVGALDAGAARRLGLVAGTPLVVGGADHVLSALAGGLREPGDMLVKLGGAGDIMLVTERPLTDARLYLDSYPLPGRWMPNGCMATSGSLLRWVQALTGGVELSVLDGEADRRPPGELLCLPYFLGEKTPLHDPELRGAFVGLHLGHDRGALHRAALEAIAYGVRHHVDVFGELGFAPRQAWVTDGGSRSRTFTQIVADVTGLSLRPVTDHPGASLGAAMLAAVSVGAVGSLDAATEVVRYGDAVEPDPQRSELYGDRYQLWRELGERLTPTSHALARRSR